MKYYKISQYIKQSPEDKSITKRTGENTSIKSINQSISSSNFSNLIQMFNQLIYPLKSNYQVDYKI